MVPFLSRVALLIQLPQTEQTEGAYRIYTNAVREYQAAAQTLNIRLTPAIIQGTTDLERAFNSMRAERAQAIVIFGNLFTWTNRASIAALALKNGLPTMCDTSHWVQVGALMAYYPPWSELLRLTADIVDKILRGADPAVIPIQQPTTFALSLNLNTAKVLRISVPPAIRAQAQEVVE
jgi:putative ABC transport system substrate-binding protein